MQTNKAIGRDVRVWHRCRISMGARLRIGDGCVIKERVALGGRLSLGAGSVILAHTRIDGSGGVEIGDGTHVGRFNTVFSHTHDISKRDVPVLEAPETYSPVTIGNDVMLFSRVTIMPGVEIGDGAVVGYGSIVTKDLDSCGIYAGVPAKKISQRE